MAAVAGEDVREEDTWCFVGFSSGKEPRPLPAVLSQDGSESLVWPLQLPRLDFAGLLSTPVRRITVYL